jgi:hypothetical protein
MKAVPEPVLTIYDDSGAILAFVIRDANSKKPVFYSVESMGMEDIAKLINKDQI